jgi:hypothetical protein
MHPPEARFRIGDIFTLKKDRTRIYKVESMITFCNEMDVSKGNAKYVFKTNLLEWMLQKGDIIILKDGPIPRSMNRDGPNPVKE